MDPDSSPANPDGGNDAPPENINELATEITQEQEDALVDRTLGINRVAPKTDPEKAEDAPAENKDPQADPKAAEDPPDPDPKPVDPVADTKPELAKTPEDEVENKPTEIAAVDTSDLWIEFEGVTVDEEGNQTAKTFKVGVDDELPDEARFKNDKQLTEYLEARTEMRNTKAGREAEREKAVAEQEETKTASEAQQATITGWDNEIALLIEGGLLEAPKVKAGEAGFNEDPTVQKIDEVFKFMASQNEERAKENKTPISSFGTAFNLFNNQQTVKDAEEKEKQEAELAKKRGSMVGGASGASGAGGGGSSPDYVYKAGSASSVHGVDTSDLL